MDRIWYFRENFSEVGPLTLEELRQAVSTGSIKSSTQVLRTDQGRWKTWSDHPESSSSPQPEVTAQKELQVIAKEPVLVFLNERPISGEVVTVSADHVILETDETLPVGELCLLVLKECVGSEGRPLEIRCAIREKRATRFRSQAYMMQFRELSNASQEYLEQYIIRNLAILKLFARQHQRADAIIAPEVLTQDLSTLGMDSMAALDVIAGIEQTFKLTVDDKDVLRFRTIQSVLNFFKERTSGFRSQADSNEGGTHRKVAESKASAATSPSSKNETATRVASEIIRLTESQPACLSSHRIGGNILYPFALFVNDCLRVSADMLDEFSSVCIENLRVRSPLTIKGGKERVVLVQAEGASQACNIRISSNETTFASAHLKRVTAGEEPSAGEWPHTEFDATYGPELYGPVLPHGKHFRCQFHLNSFSASHFVGKVTTKCPFADFGVENLFLHPGLFDGLLQACALFTLRNDEKLVLPVGVDELFVDTVLARNCMELAFKTSRRAENCYDMIAVDTEQRLIFSLRGLRFVATANNEKQSSRRDQLAEILTNALPADEHWREKLTQYIDSDLLQMHKPPAHRIDSSSVKVHSFFDKSSGSDIFDKLPDFYAYVTDAKANNTYMYRRTLLKGSSARVVVYDTIRQSEREMIMMASNNYLDLAVHPDIIQASHDALDKYGYGAGSVPLLGGTLDVHRKLEAVIAETYNREDAVVFSSGYASNVGVMNALLGKRDLALLDMYAHASLVDGTVLAGATTKYFRHNNMEHLKQILETQREKFDGALIVVDGVFSMDGDLCRLPDLLEIAKTYDARLLIDEAHAIGTIGPNGLGTEDYFGMHGQVDIIAGTLSKAPSAVGGYICGSRELCEYVRHLANSYVFSTALPPATAAGLISAFNIIQNDVERRSQLAKNSARFTRLCRDAGFKLAPTKTPIVPVILGDEGLTRQMAFELHELGVFVSPVSFPAVQKNEARLRFSIMATHTEQDINFTAEKLIELGRKHHVIS